MIYCISTVEQQRKESIAAKRCPPKKKFLWTEKEIKYLTEGVERYGIGKWSLILSEFHFPSYRDGVSLKDKWRNLVKNHQVPKKYW